MGRQNGLFVESVDATARIHIVFISLKCCLDSLVSLGYPSSCAVSISPGNRDVDARARCYDDE
jgi:hypothetical protein